MRKGHNANATAAIHAARRPQPSPRTSRYAASPHSTKPERKTRLYATTGWTPAQSSGAPVNAGRSIASEYVSVARSG